MKLKNRSLVLFFDSHKKDLQLKGFRRKVEPKWHFLFIFDKLANKIVAIYLQIWECNFFPGLGTSVLQSEQIVKKMICWCCGNMNVRTSTEAYWSTRWIKIVGSTSFTLLRERGWIKIRYDVFSFSLLFIFCQILLFRFCWYCCCLFASVVRQMRRRNVCLLKLLLTLL